tara:strand:+ start:2667 stop:3404 length:738 start_codon:yes stop_codon:yes gene_type:complete
MKKLLLMVVFPTVFLHSQSSLDILDSLYDTNEWKLENFFSDGTRFETKKIFNKTLIAVRVSRIEKINPNVISNVVMDLDNYGEFLSNANTLDSRILNMTDEYVDGYQHIKVALPFFSDRRYCFRMKSFDWTNNDSLNIIEWYLLEKNEYESFNKENDVESLYLNFGAGSWSAKQIDKKKYEISYSLYMDPKGSIPNFLTQKINAMNIINLYEDILSEAKLRIEGKSIGKRFNSKNSISTKKSYRF